MLSVAVKLPLEF